MSVHLHTMTDYELFSPSAAARHAGWRLLSMFRRWQERQRLCRELSLLSPRELTDLSLQPHDIDRLMRGQSVPAHGRSWH